MKHTRNNIRTAVLALFASAAFLNAPVSGQEPVTVSPPPPASAAPPPAPVIVPPPPISSVPSPSVTPRPAPVTRAAPPPAAEARSAPRATRSATRTPTTARRSAAPARTAAPAPAPAPVAEAPVTAPPAALPAPPVAAAPPPAPVETLPVETPVAAPAETGTGNFLIPILIAGGALLLALAAFLALRRRRRGDEVYEEVYYEEPAVVEAAPEPSFTRPAPVEAAPVVAAASLGAAAAPVEAAAAEEVSVEEAHEADVEALAADSAPVAGRPWLEFLMRPIRAGTSQDDAIVQFELTVGNTGSVPAKDVRISTWMVAGGHATDMERMLIEPPADATISEVDIAAGDGARVEAEITLPKAGIRDETVLPVVVADARYRLPDGSEGRTSASFAIGLPEGEELAGFQLDRATGLLETVEARLHGTPTRI